jgi:hypothetical protein
LKACCPCSPARIVGINGQVHITPRSQTLPVTPRTLPQNSPDAPLYDRTKFVGSGRRNHSARRSTLSLRYPAADRSSPRRSWNGGMTASAPSASDRAGSIARRTRSSRRHYTWAPNLPGSSSKRASDTKPCGAATVGGWLANSIASCAGSRFPTRHCSGLKGAKCLPRRRHAVTDHAQLTDLFGKGGCEEGDLNPHGFYPTSPSN